VKEPSRVVRLGVQCRGEGYRRSHAATPTAVCSWVVSGMCVLQAGACASI